MKGKENLNSKKINKKKVSIITIFLGIFIIASIAIIMSINVKNTNALEDGQEIPKPDVVLLAYWLYEEPIILYDFNENSYTLVSPYSGNKINKYRFLYYRYKN